MATHNTGEDEDFGEFRCLRHALAVHHDIFLSYRVATEHVVANKIALLLESTKRANGSKVRVFLDANCLLDGGDWEKNFLSALHHSKLIILLLSEKGLDLPSSSAQGLTKIQNAHLEQDNCLLEYEYALNLHGTKKATIFVLAVSKEEKIEEKLCKIRFPTSDQAITNRLQMYEERGVHTHRDKTVGPQIHQTMSKLLSFITKSTKSAPSFIHLDPDDIACRIPDIMLKLTEVEAKQPRFQRVRNYFRDIAFFQIKFLGTLLGMILPLISLLIILPEHGSPRMSAFQFGVELGHVVDFLVVAFYLFSNVASAVPKICSTYDTCDDKFMSYYSQYGGTFDNTECDCEDVCSPDVALSDCNKAAPGWSDTEALHCSNCFCDNLWDFCQSGQSLYQMYLFMALMALGAAVALLVYAVYAYRKSSQKKK